VYLTGLDYYSGSGTSLSLYGTAIEVLLFIYLTALALALWWLAGRITSDLAPGIQPEQPILAVSPRLLASWAFACALVIVPIGAALGGAWGEIVAIMRAGP
jgi:hypothetical protein